MYETFFGLTRKPFELVPNPAFLFMSAAHKKAFNYLSYGIRQQSGFILLTGEVGTGKTTLVRGLIKSQLKDVVLSKVFNTRVHSRQLIEMILDDFGVKPVAKDKPALLRELNDFLISQYSKGRQCVLIIDEAQNLTRDLLEEVRLLSNLESDSQKLLRIILAGQPELAQLLASPDLLQLRQRIQVSCHIPPLKEAEIGEYIAHRLELAGNRDAVSFEPGAHEAVARYTRAVPRLINILCDYLLLDAYANETRSISEDAVHEVARDLNFDAQYWNPPVAQEPVESAEPPSNPERPVSGHAIMASAKITSYLKHMNGRLKAIEETLPRLESAAHASPAIDQDSIMDRLGGLQDNLQTRLEEMWRVIGALAEDVHELRQNMDAKPVVPEILPIELEEEPQTLARPSAQDFSRAGQDQFPDDFAPQEVPMSVADAEEEVCEIPRIRMAEAHPAGKGWLSRLFSRAQ